MMKYIKTKSNYLKTVKGTEKKYLEDYFLIKLDHKWNQCRSLKIRHKGFLIWILNSGPSWKRERRGEKNCR